MTVAIEQAGVRPPSPRPDIPSADVRHGHHGMVAGLVRDFELAAERITDLDEIPIDLLARFARALNHAEKNALARVQTIEESES